MSLKYCKIFNIYYIAFLIALIQTIITVDFPRCVVLNSSLDIALTCSTANCVQVLIVQA